MHTDKQNNLLGAMIGLVRAASKNGSTLSTDSLLLKGIKALREAQETDALCEAIREEKFTVVPNCRYCAMPCGSTSDADMKSVWNAREEVVTVKEAIFAHLMEYVWDESKEFELYYLHKGLFVLGEDDTPEVLKAVLDELTGSLRGE